MQVVKTAAHFETTLVNAIDKDSSTMELDSVSTPAGNLPSGTYGFVIDQGSNSKREYVIGTLSGSTVTFVTRDVSPLDGETASSSSEDSRKAHRKGASVKLTNHPLLIQLQRILSGDSELDADTPIVLDASRTPATANELVTKAWVESVVNGGSVFYETQIVRADAGETVAAGDHVYFKESDGEWYLVDTSTNTDWKNKKRGIAQGAGVDGGAIGGGGVLISGLDSSISYTAGQIYYGSDTAGDLGTSAGTEELIAGVGDANNKLLFFGDPYQLTDDEKDALAGSQGTPDANNKYLTEDHLTDAGTDQTQTTQDSSVELGEADATTKKTKVAQSFIPTVTKIAGVRLDKQADTGSFSGTVTVALQADSSGSPSGSNLASKTITNADWLALTDSEEFEVLFGSEYQSLVVGDTYWIVVSASTADNSNHPNLGFNTAGGYANGTLKYNNTTDGWTEISGDDLYFKTLQGRNAQVVKTGSDGKINKDLFETNYAFGATTRSFSTASGDQTIAHGLGRVPKIVRIRAIWAQGDSGTNDETAVSNGISDGTNNAVSYYYRSSGSANVTYDSNETNAVEMYLSSNKSSGYTGVITVDDTNITITWTRVGTPTGTMDIMWEAEA